MAHLAHRRLPDHLQIFRDNRIGYLITLYYRPIDLCDGHLYIYRAVHE